MNREEAIKILNNRGTYVKDLKKVDYEIYDEDFKFYTTQKELINYALEQSKELEHREDDNNEYPYGQKDE